MTREYFENHPFEDVMEKLYEENRDVTTLNMIKDFINDTVIKGQYCQSIWLRLYATEMMNITGFMIIIWEL